MTREQERKLDPVDAEIERRCVKECRCAICGLVRVKRNGDWCLGCVREHAEKLLPKGGES